MSEAVEWLRVTHVGTLSGRRIEILIDENERLRSLLHDVAVARRGDCPDVDENWDLLPCEIEAMWTWAT